MWKVVKTKVREVRVAKVEERRSGKEKRGGRTKEERKKKETEKRKNNGSKEANRRVGNLE